MLVFERFDKNLEMSLKEDIIAVLQKIPTFHIILFLKCLSDRVKKILMQ